jgi:hypothetical protein
LSRSSPPTTTSTRSPQSRTHCATCLNLPTGATCSYSATTNTVSIATSATTPRGTYQITVVFTETLPGAAEASILLPNFCCHCCSCGED